MKNLIKIFLLIVVALSCKENVNEPIISDPIAQEYYIQGKIISSATQQGIPNAIVSLQGEETYFDDILDEWNGFKQKIASGDLEPTGTQTVTLDGVMCTVRTYVFMSDDSGEVTYYLGGPTP